MKNLIFYFLSLLVVVTVDAQTSPRFAISGGIGVSMIDNIKFNNPFKINQLAYSVNFKLKLNVNKKTPHSKSWLYYSNSLFWINNPNTPLSQFVNPYIQNEQSNLMTKQNLGIIFRRWLAIECGIYNELGSNRVGYNLGGGFIIPFKNHSIELKGNYFFHNNKQTYLIIPTIQFNIDPKQ